MTKKYITLIILALLISFTSVFATAEKVAAIIKLKGAVKVKASTENVYKPAYVGQMILSGDWLKTENNDFVALIFLDGTQLKISENAELEIKSERITAKKQSTDLFLEKGELWTKVKKQKKSSFRVATPVSVASVKGTEFNLNYDDVDKSSELFVIEGVVEFQNELGRILAREMTYSSAKLNEAPKKAKKLKKSKLPGWQEKVQVNWGFKLIPDKSGKQPVNTVLKVSVQAFDMKKNANLYNFENPVIVNSTSQKLLLSTDGSTWQNDISLTLNRGKGTIFTKSKAAGMTSLIVSSDDSESRKLNLEFVHTKTQRSAMKGKVDRIIEKKGLSSVKEDIKNRELKSSKVASGSGSVDNVLQKVETGEYEIIDIITINNPDGSVSVKLKVKPKN